MIVRTGHSNIDFVDAFTSRRVDLNRLRYQSYNRPDGGYKEHSVYEPFLKRAPWKKENLSLLATSGSIHIHNDKNLESEQRFAHFLILANDGFAAKGPRQKLVKADCPVQRRSLIVVLDIFQDHHVVRDKRLPLTHSYPIWCGLLTCSPTVLTDDECTRRWVEALTFGTRDWDLNDQIKS